MLNRKDPEKARLLTLLAALGLLYVGIDRLFFNRIVSSAPTKIASVLAIQARGSLPTSVVSTS